MNDWVVWGMDSFLQYPAVVTGGFYFGGALARGRVMATTSELHFKNFRDGVPVKSEAAGGELAVPGVMNRIFRVERF